MPAKLFSNKIEKFIREHAKGMFSDDLTDLINRTFSTNYTIAQIRTYKHRHRIVSGVPHRKAVGCTVFSIEIQEFINDHIKGTTLIDMVAMVNKEFSTNYTYNQMKGYAGRYGITNGIDARFKKGRTPANKGAKGVCGKGCEKTWFKKGSIPVHYRPIGSERVNSGGYVEIKVADPGKWRLKQRVIWEKDNGEIPKGNVIIFLDGNKQNCTIDNLAMVSRAQLKIMNSHKLIYENAEATKAGIVISKVLETKSKRKKKSK